MLLFRLLGHHHLFCDLTEGGRKEKEESRSAITLCER